MKKITSFLFLLLAVVAWAQPADQAAYYSSINFELSGTNLKTQLATLITNTHTKTLSYGNVWDASKATDVNPQNTNEVYLIYGWQNGSGQQSYTRGKNNNGGNNGQWNREHTYAKSLGSPNLGTSGPGADAHHLRPADVQWNSARGNLKFATGSGNSGKVSGGWYPGDEWKGDVARMMMYMYLRYNTRCLPANVGVGSTAQTPDGMIDLFLRWNAEDPVSALEIARNTYHGNRSNTYAQGNRNPFIDNPYLATKIWGGPEAENRWSNLSVENNELHTFTLYPNPTYNQKIFIQTDTSIDQVNIYNLLGKKVKSINKPERTATGYSIEYLPQGVYLLHIEAQGKKNSQKIIVK